MNCQEFFNEKNNSIVRIDGFIQFLRDTFHDLDRHDNEYGQLSAFLQKELGLYLEPYKEDFNTTLNELEKVREQIFFKILEIKNKIKNDLKEKKFLDKIKITIRAYKYFGYYLNSYEEKTIKVYLNTLLKFHPLILSGITLLSMICYFIYFGFKLRYFPDLGGSDMAYVGTMFFFYICFFSLFIILPCITYPGYYKNDIGWIFFFAISLLPMLTVVLAAALNTIVANEIMLIDLLIVSLVASSIYLFLIIYFDINTKDHSFFCFTMAVGAAIVVLVLICFALIFILKKELPINYDLIGEFLSVMIAFCIITLAYFKGLEYFYKKNDYIVPVMTVSIIIIAILSCFLLGTIANKLGMTNVEYKYLSIEKSAAGALPIKICKNGKNKNCDINKTYYDENETGGVVKLHNIKALSTLGKFYYLETKDGVKFELDSSKIISRQKQER